MAKIAKTVKGAHVVSSIKSGKRFAPDYFKSIRREHVIWICRQLGYPIGASATKGQAVATIINRAIPSKAPKMRSAAKKKAPAKRKASTKKRAAPKKKKALGKSLSALNSETRQPKRAAASPKRKKKRAASKKKAGNGSGMITGSAAQRAREISKVKAAFPEEDALMAEFLGKYNATGIKQTASSLCDRASPKTRKEAESALRRYVRGLPC